jgi:hypothetical protein
MADTFPEMPPEPPQPAADIRLSDKHTRAVVERERQRRGDKTAAKTARNMILERAAQLAPEAATAAPAELAQTPAALAGRQPDSVKATQ